MALSDFLTLNVTVVGSIFTRVNELFSFARFSNGFIGEIFFIYHIIYHISLFLYLLILKIFLLLHYFQLCAVFRVEKEAEQGITFIHISLFRYLINLKIILLLYYIQLYAVFRVE